MIFFYAILPVLILAVIAAIIYLILTSPNSPRRRAGMRNLTVDYAHRGLHGEGIPENSIPAFSAAASGGFGVELDVRLSSDGDVVVFHDPDLERMCGDDKKISELRGAEISWRRLGGTKHNIPLLEDVLRTIRGRTPVLIELKGDSADTSLCEAVAAILARYDGKYCVQSFNPHLLGYFKAHMPKVARGLLYTDFKSNAATSKRNNFLLGAMLANYIARPDFISVDQLSLEAFPVRMMQKLHRLPTFVWTLRDPDCHARFRSMKYGCIFEGYTPGEKRG